MKQRIVIKLSMNDKKSRSKALKIAVGISGVESAGITGKDKDQMQVVGEGIDSIELTRLLRKNVAHAELVSVGEDKKEEVMRNVDPQATAAGWYAPPYYGYPSYQVFEVRDRSYDSDSGCTIM